MMDCIRVRDDRTLRALLRALDAAEVPELDDLRLGGLPVIRSAEVEVGEVQVIVGGIVIRRALVELRA